MLLRALKMLGILLLSYCNFKFIWKLFTSPTQNKPMPYILDKKNRRVLYHGLNISNAAKDAPDLISWHTKDDFARLKDWGFNMVRYLVFWQAIEPTKGSYNAEYMQKTVERINWLKELGIDVIVDFHQDLYCKKYTGDGFPDWSAVNLPFTERHPWNLNYTEPAIIASYNNFWKSSELKNKYITVLEYLLSYVSPLENVIGIDLMNEPFQGNIFKFEKETLTLFYDKIQAMMNGNGYKTRIFFEPTMLTSSGMPTNLAFKCRPGSVFSPHYYDIFCHEGATYTWFNRLLMKKSLEIKIREAQNFGTPIMLGEFYIPSNVKNYLESIKDIISVSNKYSIGWAYYSYDKGVIINNDGIETDTLKALVGIYPQRIAGKNISISSCLIWEIFSDSIFTLKYETDPTIKGPTEIFIPKYYENIKITVNKKAIEGSFSGTVFKYKNDSNQYQCIDICWN